MQGHTAKISDLRVVAIVPCLNEEASISKVVADLKRCVPGIEVFVYDNGSTDDTSRAAEAAGATVRHEPRRGKGNVVRRAFADVDADIYLLVDGDSTYEIEDAPLLIQALLDGPLDHVLGVRRQVTASAYRRGHERGNKLFNSLVTFAFREPVSDMLSGYRVMSRRFVKSFPASSRAFEIETELTVHGVNARVPQAEVPVRFKDRPVGSDSKLRTYHDGLRILRLMLRLLVRERPLFVFGVLAAVLVVASLALGVPLVAEFLQTGLVPRFPTAILASALVILAGVVGLMGVQLNSHAGIRNDLKRLAYLSYPAPPWSPDTKPESAE